MPPSPCHSLLSIYVTSTNLITNVQTVGKLHLVDLAGSERLHRTGATGVTPCNCGHAFPDAFCDYPKLSTVFFQTLPLLTTGGALILVRVLRRLMHLLGPQGVHEPTRFAIWLTKQPRRFFRLRFQASRSILDFVPQGLRHQSVVRGYPIKT